MSFKYRKWRLGRAVTPKPLNQFLKRTWHQWSHRPPDPTRKIWLQFIQRGRGCACAKFTVRRLFSLFLRTARGQPDGPLMAQTKRLDAEHILYMFSFKNFKICPFLCFNFWKYALQPKGNSKRYNSAIVKNCALFLRISIFSRSDNLTVLFKFTPDHPLLQ